MVPPQLRGGWSLHSLDGVLSENPESDGANQNRGIRHGNQTQPEPKNSPPMLFWINFQYKVSLARCVCLQRDALSARGGFGKLKSL